MSEEIDFITTEKIMATAMFDMLCPRFDNDADFGEDFVRATPTDWAAIGAAMRAQAEKKARGERAVINAEPGLALQLFEAEKQACLGFAPSREMLARLVRRARIQQGGLRRAMR